LFPDFAPRHIYEYATITNSLQLRVSLCFLRLATDSPAQSGFNDILDNDKYR
jgi:hypothetical protein